jgi:hypothetical protein
MNANHLVIPLLLSQLFTIGVSNAEQVSGRLFTTPNERAKLDYLRQTSKAPGPELYDDEEAVTIAPTLPGQVSIQGYVKRGDGKKGTVWVNHEPIQENSNLGEVRVGKLPPKGGQVQINLPASGRNVNLKAGQVYTLETDSISEDSARMTQRQASEANDAGTISNDQP